MLGRRPREPVSSPVPLAPEVRDAIAQLGGLAKQRPELTGPARLYAELLPVLFATPDSTQPVSLTPEAAAERIVAGVPLLRGEPIAIDAPALAERWREACAVLAKHRDAEEPRRLAESVARAVIDSAALLRSVLDHGRQCVVATLAEQRLDADLGLSLLRLCGLAALEPLARSLEPLCRTGWSRGYCPACGSWPLLAEFRGLEQLRWLRCGLCSSDWQVDRLFCPFCETRDHRQLQDLFIEGQQQKYRVSVCDACRGFVLGLSTLAPLSAPALLVAELETLHLELLARQRGYEPAPSARA